MTRVSAVKAGAPRIVGVIGSRDDLRRALRMRLPPDFFEVRLDALYHAIDEVKTAAARLRAPLIITARDPQEGGANDLPLAIRRALLNQFLPFAAGIDLELRSAHRFAFREQKNVQRILSYHDFTDTPAVSALSRKAAAAVALGADIFKLATRVDTAAQLERLLTFFRQHREQIPIAAMGMGKLGAHSRIELARLGSVLNYAPLGRAQVEGQLTLRRLRTCLGREA